MGEISLIITTVVAVTRAGDGRAHVHSPGNHGKGKAELESGEELPSLSKGTSKAVCNMRHFLCVRKYVQILKDAQDPGLT